MVDLTYPTPEAEPEIHPTTRRFGTVVENVVMDPRTRRLDLEEDAFTKNARGAYILARLPNVARDAAQAAWRHPARRVHLVDELAGVLHWPTFHRFLTIAESDQR